MSDEQAVNTTAPSPGEQPSNEGNIHADGIDMTALAAAVERLLRRDLEIERERLGIGRRRKPV